MCARSICDCVRNGSVPKITANDTTDFFLQNCNRHVGNFKPQQFRECCLTKLLPCILSERYIYILELEEASTGNRHCANCIGTLSFIAARRQCCDVATEEPVELGSFQCCCRSHGGLHPSISSVLAHTAASVNRRTLPSSVDVNSCGHIHHINARPDSSVWRH